MHIMAQVFSFSMTSDTLLLMNTNTEYLTSNVENVSSDSLVIDIIRLENDLPSNDWVSGLCAYECSFPTDDSVRVTIPPNSVLEFRMYFSVMSTQVPGTAHTKILFRNVNDPLNNHLQDYYATVNPSLSTIEHPHPFTVSIFPNPVIDYFSVELSSTMDYFNCSFKLYNAQGCLVRSLSNSTMDKFNVDCMDLKSGMYFYEITVDDGDSIMGRILKK